MTDQDLTTIAQKIAKLIAKADSSTHPEESETFMVKAHDLMIRNGLDLMDLGRLSEDPTGIDEDAYQHPAAYSWLHRVASAAANYYGVSFRRFTLGRTMTYTVSGRQSARITFLLMMPYLYREVMRLGRELYKAGEYRSAMTATTRVGNSLASRIWAMVPETKKYEGEGINALVPVDINRQLLDDRYGEARTPRGGTVRVDAASEAAAANINLSRQTSGAAARRIAR